MRIAFSAETNNGLNSQTSHHFGRCPYFIFVDVEDNQVKNVAGAANPFFAAHGPGQVPGFIHQQGADVMLSGGMGGRAVQFFEQLDIKPVTGAAGTVQDTLNRYLSGELTGAKPCSESQQHHGNGHHH